MRAIEPDVIPLLKTGMIAETQPEYNTLPAKMLQDKDGTVITQWQLTWKERFRLLFRGKLYLTLLTFNRDIQPVRLDTDKEELLKAVVDRDGV